MEESKSLTNNGLWSRVEAQDKKIDSLSAQIRDLAFSVNSLKQRFRELPKSLGKMMVKHQNSGKPLRSDCDVESLPTREFSITGKYDFGGESTCLGSVYLNQKGSVEQYIEEFEVYSAKITNQSEEQLLRMFMRGLQPQIRNWVRMLLPSTYDQAKNYALKVEIVTSFRGDRSESKTRQTWCINSGSNVMAQAQSGNSAHRDEGPKTDRPNYTFTVYPRFTSHVDRDENLQTNWNQKLECVKTEEFKEKLMDGRLPKLYVEFKNPNQSAISFTGRVHELLNSSPNTNLVKRSIVFYDTRRHESPTRNNPNSQVSYMSNQLTFMPNLPINPHIGNHSNEMLHLMGNFSKCLVFCGAHQLLDEGQYSKFYGVGYAVWGRKPFKPPDYVNFLVTSYAFHDCKPPRSPKTPNQSQNSSVTKLLHPVDQLLTQITEIQTYFDQKKEVTNTEVHAVRVRTETEYYVFTGGISISVKQYLEEDYKSLVQSTLPSNLELKNDSLKRVLIDKIIIVVVLVPMGFGGYKGVVTKGVSQIVSLEILALDLGNTVSDMILGDRDLVICIVDWLDASLYTYESIDQSGDKQKQERWTTAAEMDCMKVKRYGMATPMNVNLRMAKRLTSSMLQCWVLQFLRQPKQRIIPALILNFHKYQNVYFLLLGAGFQILLWVSSRSYVGHENNCTHYPLSREHPPTHDISMVREQVMYRVIPWQLKSKRDESRKGSYFIRRQLLDIRLEDKPVFMGAVLIENMLLDQNPYTYLKAQPSRPKAF